MRERRTFTTASTRVLALLWMLCGAVLAYTAENLWVDSRLRRISHNRLPSLVPEPLSGTWALACGALFFALALAAVCHVLVWRDRSFPIWAKAAGAGVLIIAVAVSGMWFVETSAGQISPARIFSHPQPHSVTLRWNASISPVIGYNVYRRQRKETYGLQPINPEPVPELSYIDTTPESGQTYFYVARAVDAQRHESLNSNEVEVRIPAN